MKVQAWQEKTKAERTKALLDLQEQARKLRFDMATREAKNVSDYKKIKKDIARLKTLARQEEVSLDETENAG